MARGRRTIVAIALMLSLSLWIAAPVLAATPDWGDDFNSGAQQTWDSG